MWRFFQILMHNNFRQSNAINMKFFMKALYARNTTSKSKTLVVIQFIRYPTFEFKNWKKRFSKKRFFQILTHNNYKQTDGIQLEIFTHVLCWEYYSKPKNKVSHTSKIIILSLKVEKNPEKYSTFFKF